MTIHTVARHCEVPDFIIHRAKRQLEKLTRFDRRLVSAEVVFQVERHTHRVEAVLALEGNTPVIAHGEGDDFRTALDRTAGRLARILRRRRSQLVEHKGCR